MRYTAGVDSKTTGQVRLFTVVGTATNEDTRLGLPVEINLTKLTGSESVQIRDLWAGIELGEHKGNFSPIVPFHGAKLYRLSPGTAAK